MDRIAELTRRAAARKPLFPHRTEIVECFYWTAANGWRHLVGLVRVVGTRRIEEKYDPPFSNRQWMKKCRYKRQWYAKQVKHLGEKYLQAERRRKARSRERLGHN